MTSELGTKLRTHRQNLGLNIREAAAILQIATGYMSQLENGRVERPGVDVRRRVAEFLGITHLEILVMIGEISADEVATAGKQGVRQYSEGDPRTEIMAAVDAVNWYGREDRVAGVLATLRAYREMDQFYRENV